MKKLTFLIQGHYRHAYQNLSLGSLLCIVEDNQKIDSYFQITGTHRFNLNSAGELSKLCRFKYIMVTI